MKHIYIVVDAAYTLAIKRNTYFYVVETCIRCRNPAPPPAPPTIGFVRFVGAIKAADVHRRCRADWHGRRARAILQKPTAGSGRGCETRKLDPRSAGAERRPLADFIRAHLQHRNHAAGKRLPGRKLDTWEPLAQQLLRAALVGLRNDEQAHPTFVV